MQRRAVNPWDWSLKLGYNQAEVIEGPRRQLICAGQTAVDGQGKPQHPNDMRAQIALALDNLEAVLAGADMSLGDVIRLGVYATDVDEALKNFDLLGMRFGPLNCAPPMTLLGVWLFRVCSLRSRRQRRPRPCARRGCAAAAHPWATAKR